MLEEIVEFSKLVGKLKKVERTGWVTWKGLNIQNPESVAEHVFRTAILGMMISDAKKLNTEKIVRMCLLHDLAETIIGDWDIYAKRKLGEEKRQQKEKETMIKILSLLPNDLRKDYELVWKEFLEQKTEESKLVHQIDKLEPLFQALEYMKEGYNKEALNDFFDFQVNEFKDSDLKKIFNLLDKERRELK